MLDAGSMREALPVSFGWARHLRRGLVTIPALMWARTVWSLNPSASTVEERGAGVRGWVRPSQNREVRN